MVAPHLGGPLHDPASPVRVIVIGDDRCFGEIDRTGSRCTVDDLDPQFPGVAGKAIEKRAMNMIFADKHPGPAVAKAPIEGRHHAASASVGNAAFHNVDGLIITTVPPPG